MKRKVSHHRASIHYIWCGGNPTSYFRKTKSPIFNHNTWSAGNDFMTVPSLHHYVQEMPPSKRFMKKTYNFMKSIYLLECAAVYKFTCVSEECQ